VAFMLHTRGRCASVEMQRRWLDRAQATLQKSAHEELSCKLYGGPSAHFTICIRPGWNRQSGVHVATVVEYLRRQPAPRVAARRSERAAMLTGSLCPKYSSASATTPVAA